MPGNLPRVLPDGMVAALEPTWPVPPVFRWLARTGGVPVEEMLRVFNCGLGMVLVVVGPRRGGGAAYRGRGDGVPDRLEFEAGHSGAEAVRRLQSAGGLAGMRRRVAVLISGRGSNMASLVSASRTTGFPAEIALVLSNRPDAAGLERARDAGILARAIDHRPFAGDRAAHEAAIDAALRAAEVEIVCLAGYMRLLTPLLVGAWRGRMLNIHPSLLPAFPGPAHPCPRPRGRREAAWLHRPSGDRANG